MTVARSDCACSAMHLFTDFNRTYVILDCVFVAISATGHMQQLILYFLITFFRRFIYPGF